MKIIISHYMCSGVKTEGKGKSDANVLMNKLNKLHRLDTSSRLLGMNERVISRDVCYVTLCFQVFIIQFIFIHSFRHHHHHHSLL